MRNRTHTLRAAAGVAALLLAATTPVHAQRPPRAAQPRADQRATPRADSVRRHLEATADSLGACRCSLFDLRGPAGAAATLRALREPGGALDREGMRRLFELDVDSLAGGVERLRILGVEPGVRGAIERAFEQVRVLRPDRATMGVLLGPVTTRGIEVEEVTANGPAARAGIRAGERLTAVDGVPLRVAAADSSNDVLREAVPRRLTRRLDSLAAGDTVVLRVAAADGAERSVRVATVRADALAPAAASPSATVRGPLLARAFGAARGSASIGLATRATGTMRDTLGVFVASVVPGGVAERAGIHEGMRIAGIRRSGAGAGTELDLRVAPADAGDRAVAAARVTQLERALAEAKPGETVILRVDDGSGARDVRVDVGGGG